MAKVGPGTHLGGSAEAGLGTGLVAGREQEGTQVALGVGAGGSGGEAGSSKGDFGPGPVARGPEREAQVGVGSGVVGLEPELGAGAGAGAGRRFQPERSGEAGPEGRSSSIAGHIAQYWEFNSPLNWATAMSGELGDN